MMGSGPTPALVMSMIYRLPEDSLYIAMRRGGRDRFGWTHDRYLLASIYDAMNINTQVSGNWKAKAPNFPLWPRPDTETTGVEKNKTRSVASLFASLHRKG